MNFGMFERESDPFPILLSTNRRDATRGPSGIKRSCCPQRPAISYLFELTFASSVDILGPIESVYSASASNLAHSRPGSSVKARSCWPLHLLEVALALCPEQLAVKQSMRPRMAVAGSASVVSRVHQQLSKLSRIGSGALAPDSKRMKLRK